MKKVIPFSKTVHFKTMIAEVTDIEVKHTLKVEEDQSIDGDILVDGTYKMTEASQIEEKFHYSWPFTIEVDEKYDISNAEIVIRDFYFEIINEEDLKVNVELEITNVEEKLEEFMRDLEDFKDEKINQKHVQPIPIELNQDIEAVEFLDQETPQQDYSIYQEASFEELKEPKLGLSQDTLSKEVQNISTTINLESNQNNSLQTENNQTVEEIPNIFASINQEETFVTYHVYIVREQDTLDSILEKYQIPREELASYNDLNQIKVGSKIIIPCSHE